LEYRLPASAGSHTLPVPSPEGMIKFQRLYLEKFGVQLDSQTALSLATRYLHFIYFGITQPPNTKAAEQEEK